jgi:hypothetical protein
LVALHGVVVRFFWAKREKSIRELENWVDSGPRLTVVLFRGSWLEE